jgi:hypothetical protein
VALADALEAAGGDAEQRRHERELANLRRQLTDARRDRDDYEAAAERANAELSLMLRLDTQRTLEVPKWTTKPPKAGKHSGTPWLMLSDLHLDEVVQPAEIGGVNAYNRKIAERRLKVTFENTVEITQKYWSGINYDGIVCVLGGDLYSGDIHDELSQTNEDTILGSILHWSDHLAAGIAMLAEEFGRVHVPVVVGNHSRRTRKPRAKFRARDNFDWFTGHLLARTFANDARVTFDVTDAADAFVQSYSHRVCVTHGDQTTGGGGIGGIWPPIMRLDARKRARQAATNQPYDLLVMGHWHQLTWGPQFIINGSLKGYDEYAYTSNFGFEPPQQALWLMTPEHGRTWTAPIIPADRKKEGW